MLSLATGNAISRTEIGAIAVRLNGRKQHFGPETYFEAWKLTADHVAFAKY